MVIVMQELFMPTYTNTLVDLGGHAGHTPSPMGPNSFIFAYIFTEKCLRQRSTPPNGCTPPLREILDPPLKYINLNGMHFGIYSFFAPVVPVVPVVQKITKQNP